MVGECGRRSIWLAFLVMTTSLVVLLPPRTAFAETDLQKYFEWHYRGTRWTWNLSIQHSLYNTYKRVPVSERTKYGISGYGFLVTTRDYFVIHVAENLHEAAVEKGYEAYDEVSFILAFVQSLSYTSDSVTTPYDEYPRFPVETLVDGGGDCEDKAILFATLVLILNYGTIFISPSNHLAVGVWGENLYGSYCEYQGKRYYYCETTDEGWKIGEVPKEYQGISAHLYSINQHSQYTPEKGIPRILNPENKPQARLDWLTVVLTALEWLTKTPMLVVLSIAAISAYILLKAYRNLHASKCNHVNILDPFARILEKRGDGWVLYLTRLW